MPLISNVETLLDEYSPDRWNVTRFVVWPRASFCFPARDLLQRRSLITCAQQASRWASPHHSTSGTAPVAAFPQHPKAGFRHEYRHNNCANDAPAIPAFAIPDGTPGNHWAALNSAGRCTGVVQSFGHGIGRTTNSFGLGALKTRSPRLASGRAPHRQCRPARACL